MNQTYITCKTDKGRFAVRPISWASIFDVNGNIKEEGLNHTAIFLDENDAKWYTSIVNAKERAGLSNQSILEMIGENHCN